MFGKFGSILKVDLTFSKTGFKFVHVHFSAGDLPANMAMEALHNVNPTDEELKEVETAVSRAVGEFSGTEIGGLNMIVNGAGSSGRRDPPPRPAEAADAEATDGTGDGPACIGFDAGFRDGYRAGYDEGRRSIEACRPLKVTVLAADNLYKRELFRWALIRACVGMRQLVGLPDPFVVLTIDGAQTQTTKALKRTLSPYWNETFCVQAQPGSVVTAQVFDQRKFKKHGQGFLGVVNVQVSQHLNLEAGGDAVVTQNLKNSTSSETVQGRLVLQLSAAAADASDG
ncbi:hypothetical protein IWQ56_000203 [Coemansia nantahalensis]|nr:hypothetical protein IWQ56_000203 [Coemansia nantahalensis]